MTCIFDGCDDVLSMDDLGHHIKTHVANIIEEIGNIQN